LYFNISNFHDLGTYLLVRFGAILSSSKTFSAIAAQCHCATLEFDVLEMNARIQNRDLKILNNQLQLFLSLTCLLSTHPYKQGCQIFLVQHTKTGKIYQTTTKYVKYPQNKPNGRKYTKWSQHMYTKWS
jgi:hypothetical protein